MNELDAFKEYIAEQLKYTAKYLAELKIECEENRNKIAELEKRLQYIEFKDRPLC